MPQVADAVHLCQAGARLGGESGGFRIPAEASDAEGLARPAMPHGVVQEAAARHLPLDPRQQLAGTIYRERLLRLQGVVAMPVPALEKDVRLPELRKVAVQAHLRGPVDDARDVVITDSTFDAEDAMPIGCGLTERDLLGQGPQARHALAGWAGAHPAAAEFAEQAVHTDQDAARVGARDQARTPSQGDHHGIVYLGIRHGRPGRVWGSQAIEVREGTQADRSSVRRALGQQPCEVAPQLVRGKAQGWMVTA